jgi:hypothetical protein
LRHSRSQGDELQGLLRLTADPFMAVLRGTLADGAQPMRWAIVADDRVRSGPATERPPGIDARDLLIPHEPAGTAYSCRLRGAGGRLLAGLALPLWTCSPI